MILKLQKEKNLLKLYQFHSKTAKHYFCTICGIHTHNRPRRDPKIIWYKYCMCRGHKTI